MHVVEFIVLAGWIAFWIYWMAEAIRTRSTHRWSSRFLVIRIVTAAFIILAIRTSSIGGGGHHITAVVRNPVLQGVGLAFFLLGLAFAVWARVFLGRNWGMPMTETVDPELVRTGPYRYVRHPIYSGIILAMIGTALAVNLYAFIVVAVLGAYFVYSARAEEKTMTARFPTEYPEYTRSSKM